MKQFATRVLNFDELQLRKKELLAQSPDASEDAIWAKLTVNTHIPFVLKNGGLTEDVFLALRESDLQYTERTKTGQCSAFNSNDIKNADELFHDLPREDSQKLMQRLRKVKFKSSREYSNRKVGTDLDEMAYEQIKYFTDEHGIKTHSYAILLMARMAAIAQRYHSENAFVQALNDVELYHDIKKSELFKTNKDVELLLSKIDENLIYYSESRRTFYFDVSLSPGNGGAAEACEIKVIKPLSQLKSSQRIKINGDNQRFSITGFINNDHKMELYSTEDEVCSEDLRLVTLNREILNTLEIT